MPIVSVEQPATEQERTIGMRVAPWFTTPAVTRIDGAGHWSSPLDASHSIGGVRATSLPGTTGVTNYGKGVSMIVLVAAGIIVLSGMLIALVFA